MGLVVPFAAAASHGRVRQEYDSGIRMRQTSTTTKRNLVRGRVQKVEDRRR